MTKIDTTHAAPATLDLQDVDKQHKVMRALREHHLLSEAVAKGRQPIPLEFSAQPKPLTALDMEDHHIAPLSSAHIDQITFEVTQLYLKVEQIAADEKDPEMLKDLEALANQIRYMELLHTARTAIVGG